MSGARQDVIRHIKDNDISETRWERADDTTSQSMTTIIKFLHAKL